MEISSTTFFEGPNRFSVSPVIWFRLDLQPLGEDVGLDEPFLRELHQLLPGLGSHLNHCSHGMQVNHVFEHVCIEILRLADMPLDCAHSDFLCETAASEAAVICEEPRVCKVAGKLAGQLMTHVAGLNAGNETSADFDFAAELEEFLDWSHRRMLPTQDRALRRAALQRDIPVARAVGRLLVLGQGRFQQRLSATKTTLTNVIGNDLAANKDYSRRVLKGLGLPVPKYARVYRSRAAVAAAEEIGYPVVVKPNNGNSGHGVSVGMKNAREVRRAFKRAKELAQSVLVEEYVAGSDYRLVVVNGSLVAAAKRVPGHIVGDGIQTVAELLDELNSDPRRGTGSRFSWTVIQYDDQAKRLLREKNLTPDSVPAKDEVIYLRKNANTSDGGTAVDVTDDVHPDNVMIAERAAKAIGLDIAGVDLLTEDIGKSMLQHGGVICEINSRPGIRKHIWPETGKPRDVLNPILDMLYPSGTDCRMRIVAVTGTGDRVAAAQEAVECLRSAGHAVGSYIAGTVCSNQLTVADNQTLLDATRMLLVDPDIDAAVIEMPAGEVFNGGIGNDFNDVCIVTCSAIQHETDQGVDDPESIEQAIQSVARVSRQVVITNDDTDVATLVADVLQGPAKIMPLHEAPRVAQSG